MVTKRLRRGQEPCPWQFIHVEADPPMTEGMGQDAMTVANEKETANWHQGSLQPVSSRGSAL